MTLLEWKKRYEDTLFQEKYECPQERLGIQYSKSQTVFRVWAPMADYVVLHLYATGTDEEQVEKSLPFELVRFQMQEMEHGVFEYTLKGDCHGIYYTYEITREGNRVETQDPYAIACGANGQRSMVVDFERTNPEGWEQDQYFTISTKDAVIYELHVKDFSHDPNSGIDPAFRGKYLAFTQEGTTVKGEGRYSSGIDYLKELGITHVHLLPTYDYGSVDEIGADTQFNWGYDPVNYNVPEGSYATDPRKGEVRILEFKQMVKALHQAGIGVVLDMVFNHTFSLDSPLQKTVPYYYYRQNEDGSLSNGSACGNETASERTMFRQYMIDSCLYWAREYHVDGFRFDLMGIHDVDTMNAIRLALDTTEKGKNIMMYGEPWNAGPLAMAEGAIPAVKANVGALHERIAIFHDGTRDAIKGSVFEALEGGFVNGGKGLEKDITHCVTAWCDGETQKEPNSPKQVISYVSAHDNYTLWDKLAFTMMATPEFEYGTKEMEDANKLIAVILATSLGTPFFQAGEEFLRTKLGDENSYASSPSVNQLDWTRRAERNTIVLYYQGLIALRKMCKVFASTEKSTAKEFQFDRTAHGVVSYLIPHAKSAKWQSLYVVLNANNVMQGLQIPAGNWQLLVDADRSDYMKEAPVYVDTTISVKPHSAVVLGLVQENKDTGCSTSWKEEFINNEKGAKVMDFFTKVGETIVTSSKKVADSAKDQAEILSLRSKMSSCDMLIKKEYELIGKMIFEAEEQNPDSPYLNHFKSIRKNMEEKESYQQKIDLLKDR